MNNNSQVIQINDHEEKNSITKKKKFNMKHLNKIDPITDSQSLFFDEYDDKKQIIIQHGCAGTGKTLLAIYKGLESIFNNEGVDKIIIVRSMVQTRDSGFLPGSKEEKEKEYETPYKQIFSQLMKSEKESEKITYDAMKACGYVEFHSSSFIRGETWDNAVIIIDEFQSATYHELASIITRTGFNSRIVMCGDIGQDDLYSKKGNNGSGLNKIVEVIKNMKDNNFGYIEYEPCDVVRSGIVKDFIISEYEINTGTKYEPKTK